MKKKIEIDTNWYLVPSTQYWMLVYRGENPKDDGGVSVSISRTYHATIEQALNYYVNAVLKRSDTAMGLLGEIRQLRAEISEFYAKIGKFVER